MAEPGGVVLSTSGEVVHWRGPAPFVWLPVSGEALEFLLDHVAALSYGWGCIPVRARLRGTTWETALMPRAGGYLLPLKVAVRRAEGVDVGDEVDLVLEITSPAG